MRNAPLFPAAVSVVHEIVPVTNLRHRQSNATGIASTRD